MVSVLIAGWPKTGTTALHYRILNSLPGAVDIFEAKSVDSIIIDRTNDTVAKVLFPSPMGKDELRLLSPRFDLRIFTIRDPRDFMISKFLYHWSSRRFNSDEQRLRKCMRLLERKVDSPRAVPMHLFCEDPEFQGTAAGIDKLEQRMKATRELFRRGSEGFFSFKYEDLVADRVAILESYLGMTLSSDTSVPSHLKRVVRSRRAGNWRHWFTPEDVQFYRPRIDPILQELGYESDWELDASPQISSDESTEYVRRLVGREFPSKS